MSNSIKLGALKSCSVQLTAARAIVITAEKTGVRHAIRDHGHVIGSFVLTLSQLQAVQFAQHQAVSALGRKTLRAEAIKLDSMRSLLIQPRNPDCLYSIRLGGVIVGSFAATPEQVLAVKSAQDIAYREHLKMIGAPDPATDAAFRMRPAANQAPLL